MARIGLWIKAESAERREPQPTHLDRPYTVVTTHDLRFAVFYLSFESTVIRGEMYQKRKKQILHVYQKLLERNHLSRGTSPPSSHPGVRRGERRRWSAWVQHLEGRMIPVERRALEWMPSSMTGCGFSCCGETTAFRLPDAFSLHEVGLLPSLCFQRPHVPPAVPTTHSSALIHHLF